MLFEQGLSSVTWFDLTCFLFDSFITAEMCHAHSGNEILVWREGHREHCAAVTDAHHANGAGPPGGGQWRAAGRGLHLQHRRAQTRHPVHQLPLSRIRLQLQRQCRSLNPQDGDGAAEPDQRGTGPLLPGVEFTYQWWQPQGGQREPSCVSERQEDSRWQAAKAADARQDGPQISPGSRC